MEGFIMWALLGLLLLLIGYFGFFGLGIKTILLGIGFILFQICHNRRNW